MRQAWPEPARSNEILVLVRFDGMSKGIHPIALEGWRIATPRVT